MLTYIKVVWVSGIGQSDQEQSLPDQVRDSLKLAHALSTLHRTLSLAKVEDDAQLQVIKW